MNNLSVVSFLLPTEIIVLQSYITQKFFLKNFNDYPEIDIPSYILYVFDVRHHQDFSSVQPIKARLDFRAPVPAATSSIGSALLLTK